MRARPGRSRRANSGSRRSLKTPQRNRFDRLRARLCRVHRRRDARERRSRAHHRGPSSPLSLSLRLPAAVTRVLVGSGNPGALGAPLRRGQVRFLPGVLPAFWGWSVSWGWGSSRGALGAPSRMPWGASGGFEPAVGRSSGACGFDSRSEHACTSLFTDRQEAWPCPRILRR